jgi:phytoene dehydrogenase-like protein
VAPLEILVTGTGRQSVIVIGAGPAGLTAADRLASAGYRVTLLSRSAMLGEAVCRSHRLPPSILGCHQATWAFLHTLGIQRTAPLFDESTLEFLLPSGRLARYPKTRFPTPLQQLLTIGRFVGLSPAERWRLLSWLEQLWEGSLELASDLEHRTAQQWLKSLQYSDASLQTIWNPLARWLTGNDLEQLSGDAFVTAVKPFFLSGAANSRIWMPRKRWDHLFVGSIEKRLTKHGVSLALCTPAVRFEVRDQRVTGLRVKDGAVLEADWYVAAIPPHQLTPLLPERWLTRYAYFQHIADLHMAPCTVIHVLTDTVLARPRHVLMGAGPFQWILCTPSLPDRRLVAHLALRPGQSEAGHEQHVVTALRSLHLLEPGHHRSERARDDEENAVLTLSPGTNVRRPIHRSPIPNLLLAGAWTDTGWPGNLESAIVSGHRCAEIVASGRTA